MFTGLVEEVGSVKSVKQSGDGRIITLSAGRVIEGTKTGDSIAVNGACQTVTEISAGGFSVFASKITCLITNLGAIRAGDRVNLERAVGPDSRFGGHFVQGHVDACGTVSRVLADANGAAVSVEAGEEVMRYVVDKGSISVDGISLTVVSADSGGFSLYLIPETMSNSTVGEWKTGKRVNLEVDLMAKYAEKFISAYLSKGRGDDVLLDKLRNGGFIG